MTIKRILNALLHGVVGAVVTFVIGVIAVSYFAGVDLIKPYVVQSGSMEPAIKTASVVFSIPQKIYNPGDIITFAQGGNKELLRQAQDVPLITHRIEFKLYPDGIENAPVYKTSGDANEEFDRWEVKNEDIVGRVVFSIPYVGYAVDFAKRPYGFLLLVIVPATIVIYEELKVLGREFFRFLKKIRENIRIKIFKQKGLRLVEPTARRDEIGKTYIDINENTINLSPKGETLRRTSLLIPVIGSALVLVSLSASFFFDLEESVGNIFGAAESFVPEGIADHPVISEVQITGGPGNTTDDFIELYNPTNTPFNLNGYRLVKRSGSSSTDTSIKVFDLTHVIPAYGYFLWANSGYTTISVTPDVTTTDTLGAENSIALRQGVSGPIIDALSWNSAVQSHKEGTEFSPDPGANASMERKAYSTSTQATMEGGVDSLKGNGFDADNNSTDFILRTVSQPQNSTSATETP